MITVGLVNELRFLVHSLKAPVEASVKSGSMQQYLKIRVDEKEIEVSYGGWIFWRESVEEGISMFGIESCQTIAQMVFLFDKKDPSWEELRYLEST
jgi:hypothetical protein